METLRVRAALLKQIRKFFDDRGYFEVETPLLSQDTVVDAHIDPFAVPLNDGTSSGPCDVCWLQTSPEFAMKRMLAAGAEAIYQITRSFRQGESGNQHNPEFSIVEWYRVGDSYRDQMDLIE